MAGGGKRFITIGPVSKERLENAGLNYWPERELAGAW